MTRNTTFPAPRPRRRRDPIPVARATSIAGAIAALNAGSPVDARGLIEKTTEEIRRALCKQALEISGGNAFTAAFMLQLSETALRKWITKHGIAEQESELPSPKQAVSDQRSNRDSVAPGQ